LEGGEEWFWRPWARDKCEYLHLVDGTLSLEDVAIMNDLIDVIDENSLRARKAREEAERRS
jgi:hypothetical protein